jgi:tetratricopeptide (TPR) repeat protein
VVAAAFSPDGKTILTARKTIQLWIAPQPVPDEPDRIRLWVETDTGLHRDAELQLQTLTPTELQMRRDQLAALGGAPITPVSSLPWHRYQAAISERRKNWFAAAFHLKYLIDAEPNDSDHRIRRGTAFSELARWHEAVCDLTQAYALSPSSYVLRSVASAELASGNQTAFRDACRKLFDMDGRSSDPDDCDVVIWQAVQSPFATLDWEPYVSLAKKWCENKPNFAFWHETLGASFFRAGRLSEAGRELERAVTLYEGEESWTTHLFLAMTYANLNEAQKAAEHLVTAEEKFTSLESTDWEERLRHRLLEQEARQLLDAIHRRPLRAERPAPPPKQPHASGRRPNP